MDESSRVMPGTGRYKHLACLAYLFRHRHGTWADLSYFLKVLFGEEPWPIRDNITRAGVQAPCNIKCRHNHGGVHYWELLNSKHLASS